MKQHKVKTHIVILSNKKIKEQELLDTTIRQLAEKDCSVAIQHYDKNDRVSDGLLFGTNKTMVIPTPVARAEERVKRKYKYDYDVERELQVQMGTLYYLRRREYDVDGKKGIKVTFKYAAEAVLCFFSEILPVQVKVPCGGGLGNTITAKENLIGYLRNGEKGTAVKDLAKAISRRVKRIRTIKFHSS